MPYDSNVSHRGYNEKCKLWKRIKNSFDFEGAPDDVFYAKEESEKSQDRDYFMGNSRVFMERDTILIKTPDNLFGIKTDDCVEYQGEKWFVVSAKREKVRNQQSELTSVSHVSYFWYLSLRK